MCSCRAFRARNAEQIPDAPVAYDGTARPSENPALGVRVPEKNAARGSPALSADGPDLLPYTPVHGPDSAGIAQRTSDPLQGRTPSISVASSGILVIVSASRAKALPSQCGAAAFKVRKTETPFFP